MSKKPSHIPLFPDAYLRDNYRLTLEQHGLFFILLMEAWNRPGCRLPGNDEALAEIAQISVARFRKICGPVLSQWTRDGGSIFQKRLLREREYVDTKSAKRAAAANARWDANGMQMHSKCNASAMHLGEGEGEGEGVTYPVVDTTGEGSVAREAKPFRVMEGGAK